MRRTILTAMILAAATPLAAAAEDNQAGTPLAPAEAAGAWTLQSGGRPLCVMNLTKDGKVRAETACAPILPAQPAGWRSTADGMQLTGADGRQLIAFNRWSNSLFVSHRESGADVQLKRGPPQD
jgi:hypothetical protein